MIQSNFFQTIKEAMQTDSDLTLTIRKKEDQLTVLVHYKSTSKTVFPPLLLKGTAEQLDQYMGVNICRPIAKATNNYKEVQRWEAIIKASEEAVKEKATKKVQAKKPAKQELTESDSPTLFTENTNA